MAKTKKIKKQAPPLIINRFEPGTQAANKNVKKAEGRKNFIEGLIKSEKKKIKKNKILKGVDKIKKANAVLGV